MKTLWLIRHGRLVSGADRFIGRTDLPMSPQGVAEIEAGAARLADEPIERILASDLARSRRTAEIVAARRRLVVEVDPRLRELDLGAWEGRERAAVARDDPEAYAARGADLAGFRPPGGESFADLAARALPVVDRLRDEVAGTAVIAGHGGLNRVILAHLLGLPLARLFAFAQPYGCLARVDFHGRRPELAVLGPAAACGPRPHSPNPCKDPTPDA